MKLLKINLFDGEELSRIEIHTHINSTKRAASDQLTFPPPDRQRVLFLRFDRVGLRNRRQSGDQRLREESDPRFPNAGADLLSEASEAISIVTARGLEHQRSANGANEILHCRRE